MWPALFLISNHSHIRQLQFATQAFSQKVLQQAVQSQGDVGAGWRACVFVPAIFDFVRRERSEILKEIFLKFIFLERSSDTLQRFCSNR